MTLHPAGLHIAAHAVTDPARVALIMGGSGETRTFKDLDDSSTRLALALRDRGLQTGDRVAALLDNQPAYFDVTWATLRAGLYLVPINWHLTADEAGYIVADCGATALITTATLAPVVAALEPYLDGVTTRLVVDGDLPGFERYEDVVDGRVIEPVPDECEGTWMFYSSGTTGRPKGIVPPLAKAPLGAPIGITDLMVGLYGFTPESRYLSPAPLYHAAPAGWTNGTQRIGGTVVVMERFDPLEFLRLIEAHRITHVQVVPTHFVRLLKLSEEERNRYDLSSLQTVVHAAAPCPVEVKRAMLEWLGPIVHEFYAGSEGNGFCAIGPDEWLAHPGSVGRSLLGAVHIVGDDGDEVATGEEGEVWFESPRHFEYHGDPQKTASAWNDRGWSTLGDVGRVDEEGYLYLTDRSSNMIISGGVNIYPREIEDVLVVHPAIADVAVIGTPHEEMGEQVTAFVQLAPGGPPASDELAESLIAACRAQLSHFKCPREVRFVDELPRLPTGKLLKRRLLP
jgi:acyl-CoA synthetase (AMP-forming)/AMP-acid ligase II